MLVLDADTIRVLAPILKLVECLTDAFGTDCAVPMRQVVSVPGGGGDRLFVSMPAFGLDGAGVVKLVTVFPDNSGTGLPTIQASIMVWSDAGAPVAILDGTVVTHLRTGAASALASRYLSRKDSAHLVLI